MMSDQPISKEDLQAILENANWAPTHGLTEPWRFKIYQGPGREKLALALGDLYERLVPMESQKPGKSDKLREMPLLAPTVILLGCVLATRSARGSSDRPREPLVWAMFVMPAVLYWAALLYVHLVLVSWTEQSGAPCPPAEPTSLISVLLLSHLLFACSTIAFFAAAARKAPMAVTLIAWSPFGFAAYMALL